MLIKALVLERKIQFKGLYIRETEMSSESTASHYYYDEKNIKRVTKQSLKICPYNWRDRYSINWRDRYEIEELELIGKEIRANKGGADIKEVLEVFRSVFGDIEYLKVQRGYGAGIGFDDIRHLKETCRKRNYDSVIGKERMKRQFNFNLERRMK